MALIMLCICAVRSVLYKSHTSPQGYGPLWTLLITSLFQLIDEVRQFYGEDIPMIILGTKCDLKADINSDADKSKLFVSPRMVS